MIALPRDTLRTMPQAASTETRDDPPTLRNGTGIPVNGMTSIRESMFTDA